MNATYKVSLYSILALIFFLPLFFIPSFIFPLGIAKLILLTLLTLAAFFGFLVDVFRRGDIAFPKTWLLASVAALPLVYLASALMGDAPALSLFGYAFEISTFGYMLFASFLLVLTTVIFSKRSRILKAYKAFVLSLGALILFALVKILSGGDLLVLKTFAGAAGNPVGAWTDYAVIFGFGAILTLFALTMLQVSKRVKMFLYGVFALSLTLVAVLNFKTAWILVLIASLIALVYFLAVERHVAAGENHSRERAPRLAIILFAISIVFVLNPTISSTYGSIGNTLSGVFGVANTEVRPSLSATFDVAKPVLKENALLGSGPNTFQRDWLLYKPAGINTTTFWNTAFPFGAGFIPTQLASLGILGVLAWTVFLAFFLLLGMVMLRRNHEAKEDRFILVSSFTLALFLWLAAFLYVPSIVVLTLAFILTGLFVASAVSAGVVPVREIVFARNAATSFVSSLAMVLIFVGAVAIGFVVFQKTVSLVHFQRAVVLANTEGSSLEDIERSITRALALRGEDIYYRSLAEISFGKARVIGSNESLGAEERIAQFQAAMSQGISAAQAAAAVSPSNYENWVLLGSLYESLVPEPLAVEGAYESARAAYLEAKKHNPSSPEIPLLLARLEFGKKNIEGVRTHIAEALALKENYAEAYFLLTQLELSVSNTAEAIRSAETGALLSPGNAGVFFELGLLKYSNEDWTGAAGAFIEALRITPEYANAKYFLGLTLENLDRHDEAVRIFEELAATHPDNTEVATILGNLREGRAPLTGLTNTDPETRPTPPITTTE